MLRNRLYYALKPFLPRPLRLAIRGLWARRKRTRVADYWPILPGSERPPEGWPGWPEQRQFAFVLTHDVEGPEGLAKVKRLAELEMSLGFRSSFNLIPEGPYTVPVELRTWLVERGFEVGIHDLHHDGKLYHSRAGFTRKALRINHYIKSWGAAGFRAGFMLRRLDWLHDLDIVYDASAFDTDPFEPQPDGMGTIFPFWVPHPRQAQAPTAAGLKMLFSTPEPQSIRLNSAMPSEPAPDGYVELPCTLVQDSTLFLLLGETTPEVWLRKLDWVAQHGGMALINVHPDYIRFPEEHSRLFNFPVEYYRQLLLYARQHYGNSFWQALPCEVAGHVRRMNPRPRHRRPLRVAMVTHSVYQGDTRVIQYAEALTVAGHHVDVLALRADSKLAATDTVGCVLVHRLQDRFHNQEKGALPIMRSTALFLLKCAWYLAREHRRRPYDLIHVHNVPDTLVWAALYPRLLGACVILDIHDLLPEFFCARFGYREDTLFFQFLVRMERLSAACADHIIISNDLWRSRYERRTRTTGRCSVLINHVNLKIFNPELRTARDPGDAPILIFPGGLQEHQGLDVAIRAMPRIREQFQSARLHIYGDGPMRRAWEELTRSLGLGDAVRFHPPVSVQEIAAIMAQADVGVVPKRADSFGNEAYSTKIMEFMALGVPVVVSETRIDRYYFDDSLVRFFPSGDPEALARAVLDVLENPEPTRARVQRAQAYAMAQSWQVKKGEYLEIVHRLCGLSDPDHERIPTGQTPDTTAKAP